MLEIPVYNVNGEKVEDLQVDEAVFGGRVNSRLLKQAVVAYHANRRQGTSATRSRGMVEGSTRKLYRQNGNARRGQIRTNVMRGGGVAFAKAPGKRRQRLNKKMRRAALDSAILAKMLGADLLVVDGLAAEAPRTKMMAGLLKNLQIRRSCLLALAGPDRNVYLSARNLPDLTVRSAAELNAFDVATRQKMLVTREAMQALMARGGEK